MSTMDKVKNALHLNKDHDNTTSTTGHTHTAGTTHTHGTAEGVAGPHSSRAANAADPRVDSDMDGSRTTGTTGHTTHTTHAGTGMTGTGAVGTEHTGSTNAGPHNSNLANKIDPCVDSDMDGSRNMGAASHTGTAGTARTGTTGYGGTHADNTTTHHTGTAGGMSTSTNAGPHNSNLANKADPRVDSDLDGRGNRHGAATGGVMGAAGSHATPGSGTAQNTAGPHNSDMLNKLDPRVDADLDGSKTFGGNKKNA